MPKQLTPWKLGDRFSASHLNEMVDAIGQTNSVFGAGEASVQQGAKGTAIHVPKKDLSHPAYRAVITQWLGTGATGIGWYEGKLIRENQNSNSVAAPASLLSVNPTDVDPGGADIVIWNESEAGATTTLGILQVGQPCIVHPTISYTTDTPPRKIYRTFVKTFSSVVISKWCPKVAAPSYSTGLTDFTLSTSELYKNLSYLRDDYSLTPLDGTGAGIVLLRNKYNTWLHCAYDASEAQPPVADTKIIKIADAAAVPTNTVTMMAPGYDTTARVYAYPGFIRFTAGTFNDPTSCLPGDSTSCNNPEAFERHGITLSTTMYIDPCDYLPIIRDHDGTTNNKFFSFHFDNTIVVTPSDTVGGGCANSELYVTFGVNRCEVLPLIEGTEEDTTPVSGKWGTITFGIGLTVSPSDDTAGTGCSSNSITITSQAGALFRVVLSGSGTTPAFTYDVTDLNGNVLGTAMTPEWREGWPKTVVATMGEGYYDAANVFVLAKAWETLTPQDCDGE